MSEKITHKAFGTWNWWTRAGSHSAMLLRMRHKISCEFGTLLSHKPSNYKLPPKMKAREILKATGHWCVFAKTVIASENIVRLYWTQNMIPVYHSTVSICISLHQGTPQARARFSENARQRQKDYLASNIQPSTILVWFPIALIKYPDISMF